MIQKQEIVGNIFRHPHVIKAVSGLCAAFTAAVFSIGCAHAEARQVRVGLYENPPKIFTMPDGKAAGILVDILREIANKEGWDIRYVTCEWQLCLQQVRGGQIDLMPDVAFTEERNATLDFHAVPALHSWTQVFRNEHARIDSFLELEGKRIAVLDGGVQQEQLSTMLSNFGIKAQIIPSRSYEEAFQLAQDGKVDAAVTNYHFGNFEAGRYDLLDTTLYFNPARLYYATAHGRNAALLQAIDRHLSRWQADTHSEYFRILEHWHAPEPLTVVPGYVKQLLLFIFALLLTTGAVALVLRHRLKARTRYLRETRSQLQSTLDALPDLLFEIDADGRYIDYHSPHTELLARPAELFIGKRLDEMLPPAVAETVQAAISEAREKSLSHGRQIELELSDGKHWFELSVSRKPGESGKLPSYIVLSRDISGRKATEDRLQRLTNLYNALSQCNQAIVRSADKDELFYIICRDVVKLGGMEMAWIGMLDQDDSLIRPVASYGNGIEYLAGLEIEVNADAPSGRGPTGTCIREQRPYWCQDFQHDQATSLWHERAALFNWGSSASLPIYRKGKVVGAFVLYAEEVNAFDEAASNLLIEMTMDISYALDRFADDATLKQTAQELRDKDELYRTAFFTSPDAVNITRMSDGMYLDVNEGFERITGWHRDEVIGKTSLEISVWHAPEDRKRLVERLQRDGFCENLEAVFARKDGSTLTGLMSAKGVEIKGEPCILSITRDISHLRQTESSLLKLSLAVEQSPNTIVITDLDARIEYANQAFTNITGYTLDEVRGKNPNLLQSGKTPKSTYDDMWAHLTAGKAWHGELINKRKDGSIYIEAATLSPVRQADGRITHYLAVKENITDRKMDEARIEQLANFDHLTGLPNRRMLNERLNYAISLAQRNNEKLAVMFIDLDNFQTINDSLGHNIGDRYLIGIANRLKDAVRDEDTVSRLGGDEFILVFPGADSDAAALVADKLLAAISRPCDIEQHELLNTASIGIAIYPDDGHSLDELVKNADTAMNRLKQSSRNDYCFFTPEMQAHSMRNSQLISAMRQALARNELQLHYQPQVSLLDGRVIGAEALLRWQHPEFGDISPAEFIPLAEESGLIIPIGEWVLRTAAQQMKAWLDSGMPDMVVAVNLSAIQFRQARLPESVSRILEEVGLNAGHLELELTEAVAMDDPQAAVEMMDKLHKLGIRLSIDDFGTGYSSLSYLKRFKVYKLKIDQSFVRDLTEDPDDKAIVTAIINLASSLGMHTIAEGVETAGQLAYLRLQGCDEVQGYYFSKPLPAAEFETYLHRHSA
ncbi:MAG: EAL domain-containing protein [Sideroxydans sp.]|nr:EAL domain-containing protein [Sideroxydans sp.]